MKPSKFLIIVLFLSYFKANGQTIFLNSYGDENANQFVSQVTDNNGNSYFTGTFYGSTFQFGDITLSSEYSSTPFIVKVDKNGDAVWAVVEPNEASIQMYDIILDNNNNIIICGIFYNEDAVFSGIVLPLGTSNSFLVKYDPDGNIIWANSLSGNSPAFINLAIDDDDNIIVGGENSGALTFMGEDVDFFGEYDLIIVKYDKNGNEIWLKSYGSAGNESISNIATDHDGNIFISARYTTTFSIGAINIINFGLSDALIMKTNAMGDVIWVKTITGPDDGYDISGIAADENNDVYLCAEISNGELLFGMPVNNYGYSDVYLIKMHGSDGALSWYKFGGGSNYDHSASIVIAQEGVFISGSFMGAAEFDGLQLYTEFVNTFVAAYELDGDIVQVYSITGNDFVSPIGLDIDALGHVYCSGTFFENAIVEGATELVTAGSIDIFLFKFGSVLVDINASAYPEFTIDIFPNPAQENITLNFPGLSESPAQITIVNASGQVVIVTNDLNLSEKLILDIKYLPAGIYSVLITDNNNIISSQKFVKL